MVILYNVILVVAAIIYVFLLLTGHIRDDLAKVCLIIFSCVLVFIASCRYEIGKTDFYRYRQYFLQYANSSWKQIFSLEKEVGFAVLLKLCSYVTKDPQIMFFACSILTVAPFAWFINKYSKDPFLSLLIFVSFTYFFTANNATRQYVAIGISLIALHYAIKRKFIPFVLFVLLASTIHTSALFVLILYVLCGVKYNKVSSLVYVVITPIIIFLVPVLMRFIQQFVYSHYVEGNYGVESSDKLGLVLPVILFVFVVLFEFFNDDKVVNKEFEKKILLEPQSRLHNMIWHMVSIMLVTSACQVTQALVIGRLGWYCQIGVCLFISEIDGLFVDEEKSLVKMILVVFALLYFLVFNALGKLCPTPYYFFWDIY